jgi:glutathione S-transferase
MRDRAVTGAANFAQIPAIAARGLARIKLFFDMLNERLAERAYVATDSFSVADITALVTVDFARVVRCKPAPEHTHLLRWRTTLAARPSVAA